MSIEICKYCDSKIDTDYDAEHFDEGGCELGPQECCGGLPGSCYICKMD